MGNIFSKIAPSSSSATYFVKSLPKAKKTLTIDSDALVEQLKSKEKIVKYNPQITRAYYVRNVQPKTREEITKSLAEHISKLLDSEKEVSVASLESLAKGIILELNSRVDISYELKIFSKGVLKLIKNDINNINNNSIGTLKNKYEKLYIFANKIKKNLSGVSIGSENPKFKIDKNANPKLQSDYYYKAQDGEQYKTKHSSTELFNFMRGLKVLSNFYNDIMNLNEVEIIIGRNIEPLNITLPENSSINQKYIFNKASSLFDLKKIKKFEKNRKDYEQAIDNMTKKTENMTVVLTEEDDNFIKDIGVQIEKQAAIVKKKIILENLEKFQTDIDTKFLPNLDQAEKAVLSEEQITDIDKFIVDFQNASGSKNSHIKKEGNYLILFEHGKNKDKEQVKIDISQPDTQIEILKFLNNIKNKLCKDNGNTYATLVHIAHRMLLRAPLGQTITNITKENIEEANKLLQSIECILKQISESSIENVDIQEYEINNQKYYLVANVNCEAGKYNHQTFDIYYKKNNEVYNLNINPNVGLMTFINIEERNALKLAPYIKSKLEIN